MALELTPNKSQAFISQRFLHILSNMLYFYSRLIGGGYAEYHY